MQLIRSVNVGSLVWWKTSRSLATNSIQNQQALLWRRFVLSCKRVIKKWLMIILCRLTSGLPNGTR